MIIKENLNSLKTAKHLIIYYLHINFFGKKSSDYYRSVSLDYLTNLARLNIKKEMIGSTRF